MGATPANSSHTKSGRTSLIWEVDLVDLIEEFIQVVSYIYEKLVELDAQEQDKEIFRKYANYLHETLSSYVD
jgi:hypothetical protein